MKSKDQILLENLYEKIFTEVYSDSEFEDDQHIGSTNMPYGYGHSDRSPQDWNKTVHLDSFVDDYDAELSFPAFVTAYDRTQAFGGHEEGGWYYDAYEGLESVEVNSPEEAEQAAKRLYDEYKGTTDGRLDISIERTKNSQEQGPPHYE